MSQSERWQLGGNTAELYETQLVPAIFAPWALQCFLQISFTRG